MAEIAFKRLCARTYDLPEPMPGSVIRQCGTCFASVWYDPLQVVPNPLGLPEELICEPCGRLDPLVAPVQQQLDENPALVRELLAVTLANRKGMPK